MNCAACSDRGVYRDAQCEAKECHHRGVPITEPRWVETPWGNRHRDVVVGRTERIMKCPLRYCSCAAGRRRRKGVEGEGQD